LIIQKRLKLIMIFYSKDSCKLDINLPNYKAFWKAAFKQGAKQLLSVLLLKIGSPVVAGDALIPVTRIGSFVNVWLSDMILSSNIISDCFDCYSLSAGFVPKEFFRFDFSG